VSIDRVAGAMTNGRPRADFTARAMAPIHGRVRPDFTARVMARIDAPQAPPLRRRLALTAGVALVPATIAAFVVLTTRPVPFVVPPAPRIAATPSDRAVIDVPSLPDNRWAPPFGFAPAPKRAARVEAPEAPAETALDATPIYVIDALEGPDDIAMKSIEPAACTIPALAPPPPLTVPGLAGAPPAGSSIGEFKEKS
jgi:hypothetical protein